MNLIISQKFVTFLNAILGSSLDTHISVRDTETYVALRPIGLTLIIPFLNSTNVPLVVTVRIGINQRSGRGHTVLWECQGLPRNAG